MSDISCSECTFRVAGGQQGRAMLAEHSKTHQKAPKRESVVPQKTGAVRAPGVSKGATED